VCSALAEEYLGLAVTIYIRCIYDIYSKEITMHMVIYGADIRFWPTINISKMDDKHL